MNFSFYCSELSNCISDLILTVVLWFLSQKISSFEGESQFLKSWKQYFYLTGLTALLGAIGHLFFDYTGIYLKMVSWVSALVALYFLEKNKLKLVNAASHFDTIVLLKCLIFISLALFFQQFMYIKTGITLGMIGLVCPSLYYFYKQTNNKGYIILIIFILGNGFGGIAHSLNVQFASWCNGGDVAHYISCFCFYGMYVGLEKINYKNVEQQNAQQGEPC